MLTSLADLALDQLSQTGGNNGFMDLAPQLIRIFRIFRVSRLLKLVKNLQGLQRLIATIVFSLPALINASSLLLLNYFIFSILGCFVFKDITYRSNGFL